MTLPASALNPAASAARTCTVALLTDAPATGRIEDGRARRFALKGRSRSEQSARFIDFALQETRAGRAVVAVYPAWRAEAAQRALLHARARALTDEIAGVALGLSPLALSVLADRLAALAAVHPPGVVASAAKELPRHMLSGACLHSVAGLSALPTSVALHAASYLPRTTFIALCCPHPAVFRLPHGEVGESLPSLPSSADAPLEIVASSGVHGVSSFDDDLLPALRTATAHVGPFQPLGAEFWGTSRYTEFAAFETGPRASARALNALRTVLCRWCGQQVDGATCPFCRSRLPLRPPTAQIPTPRSPDHRPEPPAPAPSPRSSPPVPAPRRSPAWPHPPAGLPLAPNGTRPPHPITAPGDPRE
ncbi:hypothetical protein [Nocardiopsis halophila]|uniref:hypothetical protein n=1 Tax=Nocardiopsis halophila TaxID=141692 RepID=UPI000347C39A|nr:hypothetical protein [Nocardiopsis halophila]